MHGCRDTVEACLATGCTNLWMQDALCAWMQRYLDTEIQEEACIVTGCTNFWMQDALVHGCRDTGGSMPRYIDARICEFRMHWCKDVVMHGCRDTGGSMPGCMAACK